MDLEWKPFKSITLKFKLKIQIQVTKRNLNEI